MLRALGLGLFFSLARAAVGDVVISEWMHAGTGSLGEYVEFTNTGPGPVDMTGWSFDDDSGIAGTVSLSAFGIVAAGESVILTDDTPESFAAAWGLTDVQIVGGNNAITAEIIIADRERRIDGGSRHQRFQILDIMLGEAAGYIGRGH